MRPEFRGGLGEVFSGFYEFVERQGRESGVWCEFPGNGHIVLGSCLAFLGSFVLPISEVSELRSC